MLLKAQASSPQSYDHHRFREVMVELSPHLSFRMLEMLHPHRGIHGTRIWAASVGLSRWLLTRPYGWLGSSALEIGGGLGLVSMTLAHLNIAVECTDRDPTALLLAEDAAEFNLLRGMTTGLLDWSEPAEASASLIVGADLFYEKGSPALLFTLLHDEALLPKAGTLILANPRQRHDLFDEFVQSLLRVGYSHSAVDVWVEWRSVRELIAIHSFQLQAP